MLIWLAALLVLPVSGWAQDHLSLAEAQRRARTGHAEARIAASSFQEAEGQVTQVRGGFLPRVDVAESWQRSNLPVFVFSSLLSQRRFSAADFDIATLHYPAPLDNFRTAVMLEQTVFDESLRQALHVAELGRDVADQRRLGAEQQLAASTVDAYGRVRFLEALGQAADAAVAAADEDLARARNRRDAGLATDADVLTVDVHRAAVRQQQIDTKANLAVARARLNDLIGAPLDAVFVLDPIPTVPAPDTPAVDLEAEALRARPDLRAARLSAQMAEATVASVKASFLPTVVARASTEWNGASFGTRASGWMLGAEARINVFRGLSDRGRLTAARAAAERRDIERDAVEAQARLEVRAALARREAAQARLDVAGAAVAQARETQRILRDRYDGGLVDIAAVLRAAEAALDAEAQAIAAASDMAMQQAALDLALGR
jgi:outer membrane protein